MSDVLLVGLSDPEAGAIEVLMGLRWPNLKTHRLARGPRLELPEQDRSARNCTSCVIDLLSAGMRMRTPETEAALMQFLAARPAILLSRDPDSGWSGQPLPNGPAQQLVVVETPYSSAQLLAGLVQILDPEHLSAAVKHHASPRVSTPPPRSAAAQTAPETPPLPAWRRALELAEHLNQPAAVPPASATAARSNGAAAPAPAARPAAKPAPRGIGLRTGAVPVLLRVFPELRTQPLMILGERLLAAGDAVMLHFNTSVAFVACVQQGWVATGLRLPMLQKMLSTPTVLDQITLQSLSSTEAEKAVHERFGVLEHRMRLPLDTLTWELAATWFPALKLHPHGDLQLRLKRLPNFTRLGAVGPLDVQLAAACARTPQSMTALARLFPGREQEVYRFAVLTLLSGAAQVTPGDSASPDAAAPLPNDAQRRGFFKSLLDRLF